MAYRGHGPPLVLNRKKVIVLHTRRKGGGYIEDLLSPVQEVRNEGVQKIKLIDYSLLST